MNMNQVTHTLPLKIVHGGCSGRQFVGYRAAEIVIRQRLIDVENSPDSICRQSWKPVTLKAPFLISILLTSLSLIAVVQFLIISSGRNGGILFATNINALPINRSFAYLYLPTVIAVIYSFLWSWIDLDAKRLEPFFQLSQNGGASAKDSLLLQYQFDTIALVPLKAIRRRHWPVFSASAVMVLVFWGITPSQSGIFAIQTVTRTNPVPMLRSTDYLTVGQQMQRSNTGYAQSVFNIAWLNETLPSFMTLDYALAPFGPQDRNYTLEPSGIWTGTTRLYSVDVICKRPIESDMSYVLGACNYSKPQGNFSEDWTSTYVGYSDDDGFANYYLSQECPESKSHNFLIQWRGQGWNASSTTGINATALYCEPTYYQQDVKASVILPHKSVQSVIPIGSKLPMPPDMFNASYFESALNSGRYSSSGRGDFPSAGFPDQRAHLQYMSLDLTYLGSASEFAIAVSQRPAQDYLDPQVLSASYQAAYRLLLARQMVDVLSSEMDPNMLSQGAHSYVSQAVVIVPAFAYVVEALLIVVVLLTAIFLYTTIMKPRKLTSNPANLSSFMSLVADQPQILDYFKDFDRASEKEMIDALDERKYSLKLGNMKDSGYQLVSEAEEDQSLIRADQSLPFKSVSEISGIRPKEFRMLSGLLLFTFQLTMLVLFAALFVKIKISNDIILTHIGLPLPSSNRFVNQLLEGYIPTAVATFMEPVWVVLNRLICVLQPFEDLRRGRALSSKSINVDYTSLPPQLVFWKSFRAGHVVLTAVCFMALLANLLTISFSGLFFEDTVNIFHNANFSSPYIPLLDGQPLNNTETLVNRTQTDQFAILMSNLTARTPLPAWTDDHMFYMPFNQTKRAENDIWMYQAKTRGFGAELTCVPLQQHGPNSVIVSFDQSAMQINLTSNMNIGDGPESNCMDEKSLPMHGVIPNGTAAAEVVVFACQDYIVAGWIRANLSAAPGIVNGLYNTEAGNTTIHSMESFFMGCRSTMKTSISLVVVDSTGRVQQATFVNTTNSTSPIEQFLVDPTYQRAWHNDSYPSDLYNYLIRESTDSSRLLDYTLPVPSINETAPAFSALYSKLFATVLSTNAASMLPPADNVAIAGSIVKLETRVFMSKPMFVIAETIMTLYIIVTAVVYLRRPWRFLPRMPTSIASIVAYVAASYAVKDLEGTSGVSTHTRNRIVERMDNRYGFGTFIGRDGKVHIGIEKAPFCAPLIRERTATIRSLNDENGSPIKQQLKKIQSWKKERYGQVQEGGWI
ncbi:hypothetical protein K432DRAFT_473357 [Lepidopterella palustris CBS 459.81]|uniref:DUF3433 domain containing protein n=1 Tax=Lepidopterella palustris CBS 459.81 TaxID=1314670 RepID=A0A8E2EDP1_9PEZI|nr:hypothetical protein K432DRAFT_473357 [Lepidopterella palustris CBS 459.81]